MSSIQVSRKTRQLLARLKEDTGAKSIDEVIRTLIIEKERLPKSMFGSNPKLRSFTSKDELEGHEL